MGDGWYGDRLGHTRDVDAAVVAATAYCREFAPVTDLFGDVVMSGWLESAVDATDVSVRDASRPYGVGTILAVARSLPR